MSIIEKKKRRSRKKLGLYGTYDTTHAVQKRQQMSFLLYFPVPNFPPKLDVQYYLFRRRSDHVDNLHTLKIVDMVVF